MLAPVTLHLILCFGASASNAYESRQTEPSGDMEREARGGVMYREVCKKLLAEKW